MQLDKDLPNTEGGKLIPNKVPDQCWQVISVDMIGELPDPKGYNAVLVVVDHLSKWIHTIPTVTSLDSAGVSQLVTGCVRCHTSHGCVTHFRPILGNLVEATLMTSPFMYIVSHAKGTSFP